MALTALYPLAPLGLGTLEAESLTSYFRRLAAAHLVRIARLLEWVLGPAVAHRRSSVDLGDIGEALNGAEVMTRRLVERLEALTGQDNLVGLTLLGAEDLWFRRTLRRYRAWCPRCLRAPRPYERLVWAFRSVHACPRHHVALVDSCPKCSRRHLPWATRNVARCPFCRASLAGDGVRLAIDAKQRATQELVLRLQHGDDLTSERIAEALRRLAGSGEFQDLIAFANRHSLYPQPFAAAALNAGRPSVGHVLDYVLVSGQTLDIFLSRPRA